MTSEDLQKASWNALAEELNRWYYEPDLEALRIALSVARAHYHQSNKAVWLFVIGPSGSGKTEICINALKAFTGELVNGELPKVEGGTNVCTISDLTDKALISGFMRAGKTDKRYSLLHYYGSSILALVPDFTSFIEKRTEEQKQIMSNLREVWDGEFGKHLGNGKVPQWNGKLTLIAAGTEAVEKRWLVSTDLGNRKIGRAHV